MFNLHDFLMTGFMGAIGKMADYQIILNATGWFEKGVLTEADLAEIQTAIDTKNAPAADPLDPMMGIVDKEGLQNETV